MRYQQSAEEKIVVGREVSSDFTLFIVSSAKNTVEKANKIVRHKFEWSDKWHCRNSRLIFIPFLLHLHPFSGARARKMLKSINFSAKWKRRNPKSDKLPNDESQKNMENEEVNEIFEISSKILRCCSSSLKDGKEGVRDTCQRFRLSARSEILALCREKFTAF